MNAIECDLVARNKCRDEKREALNMIPVGMAKKNVELALALTTRAFHQLQTQLADTGPGVND